MSPLIANKHAVEKTPSASSPSTRIYTPVLKVNYTVENTRVGNVTDYDKLTHRGLDRWHHHCAGRRVSGAPRS